MYQESDVTNGEVHVSTTADFRQAILDTNVTIINLDSNIDLTNQSGLVITDGRHVTINDNLHTLWFDATTTTDNAVNNISITHSAQLTVNDATIDSLGRYGAFVLGHNASGSDTTDHGSNTLILNNVSMHGGTAISGRTGTGDSGSSSNHLILRGTDSFTADSYVGHDGQTYTPGFYGGTDVRNNFLNVDGQVPVQIYVGSEIQIAPNATVTADVRGVAYYNIQMKVDNGAQTDTGPIS